MFSNRLVVKFLVSFLIILEFFVFSYAADVDLDKIVVTPYRYGESLGDVPASLAVISSEQIASSSASTTVGLLSDLSGVVVWLSLRS